MVEVVPIGAWTSHMLQHTVCVITTALVSNQVEEISLSCCA